MVDGIVKVISKPELLEVSHTDFYNHNSLINNIVSKGKLEILQKLTIFQVQKPMTVT